MPLMDRLALPLPGAAARIETERLVLRPPRLADARDVFAYSRDGSVSRYVLWDTHACIGDTRRFLAGLKRENRLRAAFHLCAVLRETGRVVGTVGFCRIDRENGCAEAGYSFGRAYWGRGLATEALAALMRCGFDGMGFHRIEGRCDVRNPASARVMEKCGMRREGLMRHCVFNKGEYADILLYARVKEGTDERQPV